ncbi:MAG: sigma-54 dependent transcriptional regulator [candidate division Zixibacteria bacterium]|nr:sigma-54 dependent transcriptional regulator [candidate division Zixibacteria bacterium]
MIVTNDKARLLIVDDSADTRELLDRNLSSQGYRVLTAADVAQALTILGSTEIDLVITDLKLPGVSGLELVRHVSENFKDTEVMMITGYPSVEGAVAAVRLGAQEYLTKPFTKEELFAAVRRVMERLKLRATNRDATEESPKLPLGLIGDSASLQTLLQAVARCATSAAPVLLSGEYGTGKALVARAIHCAGPRAQAPFIPVVSDGVPEEVLTKQLFGHADPHDTTLRRPGLLELADGGTVYFREVSHLPLSIQENLSAILRDKQLTPPDSNQTRPVDFRLICDTQRDLRALTSLGAFLEDLYARISINAIHVPALRDRGNDILLLAHHFLRQYATELGKRPQTFSDRALDAIKAYPWPGNVGELENVVRQLVSTNDAASLDVSDLPAHMRFSAVGAATLNRSLADVEAEHIRDVMTTVGGNQTKAAQILGINRKTLREKLKQSKSSPSE